MGAIMSRNPATTWEMLNVAMTHFQTYIASKSDRFALSITDLLHVSNFKGGNASITEPEPGLSTKLRRYEAHLRKIDPTVSGWELGKLGDQLGEVKVCGDSFLHLASDAKTKIRGFGPSYASALLHAFFPDVMPVLDRRILNGAGISVCLDSQGQVKNIGSHYGQLIDACQKALSEDGALSLRQLDKRWFCAELPERFSPTAKEMTGG
jgi:hypothetical protein